MNIYSDYIKTIKSAINAEENGLIFNEKFKNCQGDIVKSFSYKDSLNGTFEKALMPSLDEFAKNEGLIPNFNQKLGIHPDFAYLKNSNEIEKHYIISMFIDIEGSTNLFKKYKPETVLVIINTIQQVAIHTCLIFGGYIHRLQGDGLFVYFGGKTINKIEASKKALQCASVFTYFVSNDLKKLFDEKGIVEIKTRIGVDLGYDKDVIWSNTGVGEISEITTCSLHTSLASKMQVFAKENGVVIGSNMIDQDNKIRECSSLVGNRTNKVNDNYIFQIPNNNYKYMQYDFDWLKYLKSQIYIITNFNDDSFYFREKDLFFEKNIENLKPIASLNKPYFSTNDKSKKIC